jgi:sulfane dehydrogenase subunit SoxC
LKLWAGIAAAAAACRRAPTPPPTASNSLGAPISAYGSPAASETAARMLPQTTTPESTASFTPLHEQSGILTPSGLHFERHHAGVPTLASGEHELLVHGRVGRATVFTMADLERLPSVSRICFLECSGNAFGEWRGAGRPTVQSSHGLASCSEWTGVPLREVLERVGVADGATWLVAEGADACRMSRSLPLERAFDDVLLAWGQNGEALRPEQGYPQRLLVPGCEGNVSVKWLRQIKVVDTPAMTKDETSKYTDLLADGTARQFTFLMEARSVITSPSGGQTVAGHGHHEIRGLAWSGRGTIERVEVSLDSGRSWRDATLDEPRLPKAFTRFRLPWQWQGEEAVLMSRATDDTGYVQPTRAALIEARGLQSNYHNNAIKPWRVAADGSVTNVEA